MPNFESGISDYIHCPLNIDITFPIDNNGQACICCDFCKLFTGRKCCLTGEVILLEKKFVGDRCPLKVNKKE